jgi:hypothetical protein
MKNAVGRKPKKVAIDYSDLFPQAWLLAFSLIAPPSIVRKLLSTCRYMRKTLTTNTTWLNQSNSVPRFAEMDDYEKYVMKQPEGFWFQWYLDNVVRKMKIVRPREGPFTFVDEDFSYTMQVEIAEVGSIFVASNGEVLVAVEIELNNKGVNSSCPKRICMCPSADTLESVLKTGYVHLVKAEMYGVVLRSNGNYSIDCSLVPPREYSKLAWK